MRAGKRMYLVYAKGKKRKETLTKKKITKNVEAERMTIKQKLRRARNTKELIEELKNAKRQAFEIATKATVTYDVVKARTTKGNAQEEKQIQYISLCEKIEAKEAQLLKFRAAAMELIEMLDNNTLYKIMISYYVNCDTWEAVAEKYNYSVRHVHRLHGTALQELEKKTKTRH